MTAPKNAPKKHKKICTVCNANYEGLKISKFCLLCLAEWSRKKNRKPGSVAVNVEKVCNECGKDYLGPQRSKYCLTCYAERFRESNRVRRIEEWRSQQAIKVAKVKAPKLPPACQQCHYCKETDQYPSGMACLAEAFLRCQPWSLGAKPLKEKENAI